MNKITTVLFDLDGTILDTNELIIRSLLHALADTAPPGFGREKIIPWMGQPIEVQMRQFSGREQVDDLIGAYRQYYREHQDRMISLFPHAASVVSELKAGGIRLGVVTTKMRASTEQSLRLLGLYETMEAIVTVSDVERPKPHPEPVLKAMAALKAEPSATLMVGDSPVDVEAAIRAGAVPAGVAWSLKGEAVLRAAGARLILQDLRDLLHICGIGAVEG
jgi:pyrophosphatase PpaX